MRPAEGGPRVWARSGDLPRLGVILMLCAVAGASGEWLASRPYHASLGIAQPAEGATLRGLVAVTGWAVDDEPRGQFPGQGLSILLDQPDAQPLGRPLVKTPRQSLMNGFRFELGWETCTFPPGSYALRAALHGDTAPRVSPTIEVTVAPCPTPPLGVLRADPLTEPTAAWQSGATACVDADYAKSAYRLRRTTASDADCGVWDGAHVVYGDFLLGADIELPNAEDTAVLGFRAHPLADAGPERDGFSGYLVRLDPSQRVVRLERHMAVSSPHAIATGRLPAGDPYYTVHVLAVNDLLSVHVNGRLVLMVRDEGPRWGRLYLGMGGGGPGTAVLFRDISLRRVPGPGNAALTQAPVHLRGHWSVHGFAPLLPSIWPRPA